jgi:hypothetical protein
VRNNIKRVIVVGLTLVGVVALSADPAQAITQGSCPSVTSVSMQPLLGGQPDTLYMTCQGGASYFAFIGPSTTACAADADVVKSYLAIALTARVSGSPVQIDYSPQTNCPGIAPSSVNVIQFLGM